MHSAFSGTIRSLLSGRSRGNPSANLAWLGTKAGSFKLVLSERVWLSGVQNSANKVPSRPFPCNGSSLASAPGSSLKQKNLSSWVVSLEENMSTSIGTHLSCTCWHPVGLILHFSRLFISYRFQDAQEVLCCQSYISVNVLQPQVSFNAVQSGASNLFTY